jgi:hypothetical protein
MWRIALRAVLASAVVTLAACAGPRPQIVREIPFRYVNHEILIATRVAGQGPFSFLLDTGVTPSGVDAAIAPRLGIVLDEAESGAATGVGNANVTAYAAQLRGVEIDGVNYGDIEAAAVPMAGLSRRLGEPLHGILGASFLEGKIVTIDYRRRLVILGRPAPGADTPGVYRFAMITAPDDIMPLMQVSIAGHPLTVSMDTGSSGGLEIFAGHIADAGLEGLTAGWETSSSEGVRGPREIRRGVLPAMNIGPFELRDAPGVVAPRDGERYRQGNAGNQLFERFIVTFDYVGRTVTLQRADQAPAGG